MRHGSERTTSCPLPASAKGRHIISTRRSGWTVLNVHAESGSRPQDRDARAIQLVDLSRSYELQDQGQLCVLAGGLNLRAGEDRPLRRGGGKYPLPLSIWTFLQLQYA